MSIHPESSAFTTWTLADRMRKSLDVAGMKVEEMAEYLEVSRGTVGNWINGRNKPQAHTLKLWAMRTGAPLEWLKTGDEKKPPTDGGGRELPVGIEPTTFSLEPVRKAVLIPFPYRHGLTEESGMAGPEASPWEEAA